MNEYDRLIKGLYRSIYILVGMIVVISVGVLMYGLGIRPSFSWDSPEIAVRTTNKVSSPAIDPDDRIEDGVHVMTGLKVAPGYELVRANCTACHSANLITQNRASREGWQEMIVWMQAEQGLWDLGTNETPILNYLAANYAPEEIGRRSNLDVEAIEWYLLSSEE